MTTKLAVYNLALGHLGERRLATLTENREPRRVLDDNWDAALSYCLEQGLWNFAQRTVMIDASASIEPAFGYTSAFEKPDDWLRTFAISASERMDPPLLAYHDENELWYADADPIYVSYVSNGAGYGGDLGIWPQTFADYIGANLAKRACKRIENSKTSLDDLKAEEKRARAIAMSKDAMDQAVGFPPTGSWVNARLGGANRSRWNGQSR